MITGAFMSQGGFGYKRYLSAASEGRYGFNAVQPATACKHGWAPVECTDVREGRTSTTWMYNMAGGFLDHDARDTSLLLHAVTRHSLIS